ncbi:ribose 5-phosphate isomerase B [Candidatus Puniceispirillum sp.]|uniref:ribose 5-phosphate isomerase B n=1 Tax=Candidatus Puniceispirillum sp. TaxID=2026719 RepID=UPI003F69D675
MATNAKIYLASDHAGVELRSAVAAYIAAKGLQVVDLGPDAGSSVDYPDYGEKLAMALSGEVDARGVAICGSGIGISIAVNRFPWVRAALVTSAEAARLSREHNNANVIALGERLISQETALACIDAFLTTDFEGGRHARRVDKLTKLSP